MEMLETLRQIPLFEDLEEAELDAVAKCVVPKRYSAGEVIIQEGWTGSRLFIVQEGEVKVEKEVGGQKVLLSELGPGAAVGEMSLLDSIPTSASVTAVTDTDVLTVSRLDLNVLLNWDTVLASKMWRSFALLLSQRLRDTNENLLQKYGAEALQS